MKKGNFFIHAQREQERGRETCNAAPVSLLTWNHGRPLFLICQEAMLADLPRPGIRSQESWHLLSLLSSSTKSQSDDLRIYYTDMYSTIQLLESQTEPVALVALAFCDSLDPLTHSVTQRANQMKANACGNDTHHHRYISHKHLKHLKLCNFGCPPPVA